MLGDSPHQFLFECQGNLKNFHHIFWNARWIQKISPRVPVKIGMLGGSPTFLEIILESWGIP